MTKTELRAHGEDLVRRLAERTGPTGNAANRGENVSQFGRRFTEGQIRAFVDRDRGQRPAAQVSARQNLYAALREMRATADSIKV